MQRNGYSGINEDASRVFGLALGGDDRVVVTGASGWFGQTALALCDSIDVPVLALGTRPRELNVLGFHHEIQEYEISKVSRFSPTLLLDFAYITREHAASVGEREYRRVNESLTQTALFIAELPTISRVLATSSGAAVHPTDASRFDYSQNPYGFLKRMAEHRFREFAVRSGKKVVTVRPWSVSGTLVTKPDGFAFSSFIKQAASETIRLNAMHPVFRRYVSVEDLLAASLAHATSCAGDYLEVDSGGDLVSLVELAHQVAARTATKPEVVSAVDSSRPSDGYFSDNHSWLDAVQSSSLNPASLIDQIDRCLAWAD